MMRAVRFAARFGFQIEPETMAAARELARQITQVSPERIREELTKLLTEGAARRGFELLDETGLLAVVLPDVARMKGVEQPPQFHPEGDVWIHTRMMLEKLPPDCSPRWLGACCCTTWASRRHLLRPQGPAPASVSMATWKMGARMAESICRDIALLERRHRADRSAGRQSPAV